MAKGIGFQDLTREIMSSLKAYTQEVQENLEDAKEKVSTAGVKMLKETSPKKTGDYAKGWRKKKDGTARIIHNSTDHQLTHLLEKSHAKRNGGRTVPVVHIKPVEEYIIKEYEEEVIRELGK